MPNPMWTDDLEVLDQLSCAVRGHRLLTTHVLYRGQPAEILSQWLIGNRHGGEVRTGRGVTWVEDLCSLQPYEGQP